MSRDNAKIIFEGLLLFCFPRKTGQNPPDTRDHCEIGILVVTGDDEHEVVIEVKKKDLGAGQTILVPPGDAGMIQNPLKLSHSDVKQFSSLRLYVGAEQQTPPTSGKVVKAGSFDKVLDLEGDDFYDGRVNLIEGRYTSLFVTSGIFAGHASATEADFCRVSRRIVEEIKMRRRKPIQWGSLLDHEKRVIGEFSKQVKAEIEIGQNQVLAMKGSKNGQNWEQIFRLPHPSVVNAERYVITFGNVDKRPESVAEKPSDVINNCSAFLHHSLAIESRPGRRPEYGLTINFDHNNMTEKDIEERLQRSDDACCDCARLSRSESLSNNRGVMAGKGGDRIMSGERRPARRTKAGR